MKIKAIILTSISVAGTMGLLSAAELTGKVTLKGTPPPEKQIDLPSTDCGKVHTGPAPTTRHYVVGKDSGLANVFVYVKEGAKGKYPVPTTAPMIDQVGCMYQPYVVGVMAGQKVQFKNSDPFMHNVHPMPKVEGNEEKNFAQVTQGKVDDLVFPKAEMPVKVVCNVHAWMFAYVAVVDNPYFAVTDKDGNFKISGLPAGTYTIEAFHEKTHRGGAGVTQKITVGADDKKTADFVVEVKAQ